MALLIEDLRVLIDQQTEKIVSGFKDRSRYSLNKGVFTEPFSRGMTWFEYRLKQEQNLDSQFGRYEFPDQHPVLFKKEELSSPLKKRKIPESDLAKVHNDRSFELIKLYKEFLPEICKNEEDEFTYGETAKLDVDNVLNLQERVYDTGRKIAEYKLQKEQKLIYIADLETLSWRITDAKREKEVADNFYKIASDYNLPNPEAIKSFARKIIDSTVKAEVDYIGMLQERDGLFIRNKIGSWCNDENKKDSPHDSSNSRGWSSE